MAARITFQEQGAPEVLALVDCPVPTPAPDQVLVRVAAAGVNFVDLYQRSGAYTVQLPFTPGFEASGVVEQVGESVTEVAVGDRVAWFGSPGGYAEYCLVPAQRLLPVPDGLDLESAAAALIQGMTAHFLAHDVTEFGPGSTVLVHAAAGGVGALLCQYAVRRGARVIGTASGAVKAAAAHAAGAEHVVLDYSRSGFREQVRELTGGRGVDVVFDGVGLDTALEGLDCLRPRGMLVLFGQTSGAVEPIDPQLLSAKGSLFLTKASLSHYDTDRAAMLARAGAVFADVLAGRLRLRIHGSYLLADAALAHQALESRTAIGKVLLRPAGSATGAASR
ncbi:MAG: quinone oxidoreductase [Jatrophihabitantaceae bacterium]